MKLFLVLLGVTLAVAQTDVTSVFSESPTEPTSVTESVSDPSTPYSLTSEATSTEVTTANPDAQCGGDKFVYSEGCFDYCMKQIDRENVHIREVYPVFIENRVCKVYSRVWFFFVSKEGVCKKQEINRGDRVEVRGVCVITENDN